MWSQASRQAPGEPGRQKTKVVPIRPAVARDWMVEVPILAWLIMWKTTREAVDALVEQRLDRLRRHVAAGEPGAAGGDDGVDRRDRRRSG